VFVDHHYGKNTVKMWRRSKTPVNQRLVQARFH
jgi:hypothetical protein